MQRSRTRSIPLALMCVLAGGACASSQEPGVQETEAPALGTTNGLAGVNGLGVTNGLASTNGLAATNGLMTTSAGRDTIAYLVKCALPAGRTITKVVNGTTYSFPGQIGLAPQWETGACDVNCQQLVSACLLAHINTSGQHIALWLDSDSPAVGW